MPNRNMGAYSGLFLLCYGRDESLDSASDVVIGSCKAPCKCRIVYVSADRGTSGGGTLSVDVKNAGTTVLSSDITQADGSEGTPAVADVVSGISETSDANMVAEDAIVTIEANEDGAGADTLVQVYVWAVPVES